MKTDGVLFDLDGTLWDATTAIRAAWITVFEQEEDKLPIPSLEAIKGVMGMTAQELMSTLFPEMPSGRAAELFEKCCASENAYLREHGGILYPGMEELLEKLSEKVSLGIVSNCNSDYIPCFLEAHRLGGYFADWECIGRTGLQKWENIRLVAERSGMKAPVYIGDTHMDKAAADKAGVPFIHAAYGFGKVPGAPAVSRPSELLELLEF